MGLDWLALPGLFIWASILLLPWRPWSTRETLDTDPSLRADLSDITVLIPARNEEDVIDTTLRSLTEQGDNLRVILIDDQSTDNSRLVAERAGLKDLTIINGSPLPAGWSGKLWALEQGRKYAETSEILLLDADIGLQPGLIATLSNKMETENLQFISLMARLRMESLWEKLLMPAFIFFFKLLYPFHISNSKSKLIAAAAGGCILIKRDVLVEIGGFEALRNALIDDCTLARKIKLSGYRTWIGLSHSAISYRQYNNLKSIWEMVARTAYTQLHYSAWLLMLCTLLLLAAFVLPVSLLFSTNSLTVALAIITIGLMVIGYLPTLSYYNQSWLWAIPLPLVGLLYLLMTWNSATNHWRGSGSSWKDRNYTQET